MNLTNISNEYKIDVTIGSQKYNLDNIDQHNIIDTDPILIGLIFDGNKVKSIVDEVKNIGDEVKSIGEIRLSIIQEEEEKSDIDTPCR